MKKISFLIFTILFTAGTSYAGTIELPRTGQTTCYDESGTVITCSGTGQDGDIQAGVAWPSPRFTDNGDGTITDNLTGLMWLQDAGCFVSRDWPTAVSDANSLANGSCGLSDGSSAGDWRLPNVNELESLVNAEESNSATWLNAQGFTNVSSYIFWSATTRVNNTSSARYVLMRNGYVASQYKTTSYHSRAWPVRAVTTQPAQVWKTGQTTSYATGDDGDLQKGVVLPSPRFADNGNGTVTDNLTGLIWLKDANCIYTQYSGVDSDGAVTWQSALDFVAGINDGTYSNCGAGFTDWRLPNRKELHSLTDYSQYSPSLPSGHPFTNVQSASYWSGTTGSATTGSNRSVAWIVGMVGGGVYDQDKLFTGLNIYYRDHHLWPVRTDDGSSGNSNISISPTSYDFSSISVGSSSSSQTFTVSNTGTADLVIGNLSITGTDSSEFSAQSDNCSGQTIASSGTCTVQALFSPASSGAKSANLSIPSNDPDTATLDVALTGTGGTGVSLNSISISPASVTLTSVGATQQLTVTANYSDSTTQDVTSSASYSSSDKAIAIVSTAGLIRAFGNGTATITASYSGKTATASVTVNTSNTQPSITILEPDGSGDTADSSFTITWTDSDPDDDAAITLYYKKTSEKISGIIVKGLSENSSTNSYSWNTSAVPSGNYEIRAYIDDGINKVVRTVSPGEVTVAHTSPSVELINPAWVQLVDKEDGSIKTDTASLAAASNGSLNVTGIVADGVSKILIRYKSTASATFLSLSDSTYGSLSTIDSSTKSTSINVSPVTYGSDSYIFAIYNAPFDFPNSTDQNITVNITANGSSLTGFTLYRVPVVLVHGLWSGPTKTWQNSDNNFESYLSPEPPSSEVKLTIQLADYEHVNAESFDSTGAFLWANKPTHQLARSIVSLLTNLKQQNIVASQVDVVGHSMGGLIARALDKYDITKGAGNYKKGFIHRLITIGTPHNGSPLADFLYNDTYKPCKSFLAALGKSAQSSAVKDLIPGSNALKSLGSSSFKTYAISATADSSTLEKRLNEILFNCSKLDVPIGYKLDYIMGTSNHDAIVSKTSQEGNINAKTSFTGIVHTVIGKKTNSDDTIETASTDIMVKVKSLLLGSSDSFEVLPAPQAPANYAGFQSQSLNKDFSPQVGSSDEIVITSPTTTDNITAGSSVTLTVTGNSVTFTKVLFIDDSYFVIDESSPFTTTIEAPYISGSHTINISAYDGTNRYSKDLVLNIIPSSTLVSIAVEEDPVYLPAVDFTSQIKVTGTYADSSTIDLTDAASGTSYFIDSDAEGIISVDSNGLITALSPGLGTVIVANGGKTTYFMATVDDDSPYISSTSIPTLSEWGIILLILLFVLVSVMEIKKRRQI